MSPKAPAALLHRVPPSGQGKREGSPQGSTNIQVLLKNCIYSSPGGLSFFSPKRGAQVGLGQPHASTSFWMVLFWAISSIQDKEHIALEAGPKSSAWVQKRVSLTRVPMGTPQGWSQSLSLLPWNSFSKPWGINWEDLSALIVWLYSCGV